jgi:hypothetical protein
VNKSAKKGSSKEAATDWCKEEAWQDYNSMTVAIKDAAKVGISGYTSLRKLD